MKTAYKVIIVIIAIIVLALGAFTAIKFSHLSEQANLLEGEQNLLVLGIDESEPRPGLGACDMAFIVHLSNGSVTNYTPVYPGGMRHNSVSEPEEYQAMGAGSMLLLHDSFYWNDSQKDLKLATEIVEQNTGENITMTVAITASALDEICKAAGQLQDENGNPITIRGIDFIREDQYGNGNSRGDAVIRFAKILVKAAHNEDKKDAMFSAALDQYNAGQIVMSPEEVFEKLIVSKGLDTVLGD